MGKLDIQSERGHRFRLTVRVNDQVANNFSVLVVWFTPTGEKILLIRCNGFHERHVNRIEKTVIPADTCHIHTITERYQVFGKPDGFAEETYRYVDVRTAIKHATTHYGFYRPTKKDSKQPTLPGIDE